MAAILIIFPGKRIIGSQNLFLSYNHSKQTGLTDNPYTMKMIIKSLPMIAVFV